MKKTIKLTDLSRNELLNDELNNLKGGESGREACFGCNCTCTCASPTPAENTTYCTSDCKRAHGIIGIILSADGSAVSATM